MPVVRVPLVGPAGEPVKFRATINSHGVAALPPARRNADLATELTIAWLSNANTRANADPKDWSTHTYLLWEPGFGGVLDNETSGQFTWLGGGGSLGLRLNRYDEADSNVNLVVGAWLSGGRVLVNQGSHECGDSDTRPFAALVVGIRGFELYASPKIGVMHVPGFCLNIFDDGESF